MATGTTYVIKSIPVQLFHSKDRDCFIYNTGNTTVYLDTVPGVTVYGGMPLPPSSSKVWLQGDDCWAITNGTDIGNLNVTDNAGDVVNPAAVATSLLNSGLAAQIAADIKVSGAPPIDTFAMLDQRFLQNGQNTPFLSCLNYQTIFVTAANAGAAVGFRYDILWYSDGTGTGQIIGLDSFFMGTGQNTQASFIVRGPWFIINSSATSGIAQLTTYGSYKLLQNNYYDGQGAGAIGGGVVEGQGPWGYQTWNGTIPVNTTWTWQPDTVAGHNILTMRYVSVSTISLIARLPATIASLTTFRSETNLGVTSGTMSYYDIYFPPAPFELSLACTSASANPLVFRATLVPVRTFS